MLSRLEAAMLQGIALASLGIGCSGTVDTTPTGGGDSTSTGGTSASTGGGTGTGTGGTSPFDPNSLPPLPTDRDFPHQVGPDEGNGPYYGYCTGEIHCAELLGGTCPALDNLYNNVPGYPAGSGSCSCTGGVLEHSEEGPFRRDLEL